MRGCRANGIKPPPHPALSPNSGERVRRRFAPLQVSDAPVNSHSTRLLLTVPLVSFNVAIVPLERFSMPEESLWSLVSRTVSESGSIEKAVFFLLMGLSIVSWCILFLKLHDLSSVRKSTAKFSTLFDGADNFGTVLMAEHSVGPSPMLSIFKAAITTMESIRPPGQKAAVRPGHEICEPRKILLKPQSAPGEIVLLSMQHTAKAEFARLQRGLSFMATVGSTSPFIGLFGTVWGIMDTFRRLGDAKTASIAVVAPGISSALIATAAGLAVAIPAVMAYNWFLSQINDLQDNADSFIERVNVLIHAGGWHDVEPSVMTHTPHPVSVSGVLQQDVRPTANSPQPIAAVTTVPNA